MATIHAGRTNRYSDICRDCGRTLEPGEGFLVEISYYDWDHPDPDIQGSIPQIRWEVECPQRTDCARRVVAQGVNLEALRRVARDYENLGKLAIRAKAILRQWSEMTQEQAHTDDLVAREQGYGSIGSLHWRYDE